MKYFGWILLFVTIFTFSIKGEVDDDHIYIKVNPKRQKAKFNKPKKIKTANKYFKNQSRKKNKIHRRYFGVNKNIDVLKSKENKKKKNSIIQNLIQKEIPLRNKLKIGILYYPFSFSFLMKVYKGTNNKGKSIYNIDLNAPNVWYNIPCSFFIHYIPKEKDAFGAIIEYRYSVYFTKRYRKNFYKNFLSFVILWKRYPGYFRSVSSGLGFYFGAPLEIKENILYSGGLYINISKEFNFGLIIDGVIKIGVVKDSNWVKNKIPFPYLETNIGFGYNFANIIENHLHSTYYRSNITKFKK